MLHFNFGVDSQHSSSLEDMSFQKAPKNWGFSDAEAQHQGVVDPFDLAVVLNASISRPLFIAALRSTSHYTELCLAWHFPKSVTR